MSSIEKVYAIVVTELERAPYLVDIEDYKFDSETQTLSTYGANGRQLGMYDFRLGRIKKIDIYDKSTPQSGAIQTFLGGVSI